MYGGWTKYVRSIVDNFLGFIWDRLNVFMMYNYWVWAHSRRSKSWIWMGTFFRIFLNINDDDENKEKIIQ